MPKKRGAALASARNLFAGKTSEWGRSLNAHSHASLNKPLEKRPGSLGERQTSKALQTLEGPTSHAVQCAKVQVCNDLPHGLASDS